MNRWRLNGVAFVVIALSLILALVPLAACTQAQANRLQGMVQSVDVANGKLTIVTKDGQTVTIDINSTTGINLNGLLASLNSLEPGSEVEVELGEQSGSPARSVHARLGKVEGNITGITGSAVVVTTQQGSPVTVTVVNTTHIELVDSRAGSLSDLRVGQRVEARYDPQTGWATKIELKTQESGQGNESDRNHFVAHLSGAEEVPPVVTQAQGQATFSLNDAGTELSFKLTVANLTNIAQAHIHLAARGQNGPVVAWLYPAAPPSVTIAGRFDGVLTEGKITAGSLMGALQGQPLSALIDKLRAGEAYANIHTTQYPAGEIRGQISTGVGDSESPDGESDRNHFNAHLSGAEEVPPATTTAQGQVTFELNAAGTELTFKLTVANLANIAQAHIHLAARGQNGQVVAWLYPAAPPAVTIPGSFNGTLAEGKITATNLMGPLAGQPLSALIDRIRAGEAYANVHTSQYPAGEIRGQIAAGTENGS